MKIKIREWELFSKGALKWNLDGSVILEEGKVGIGGVLRDWNGNFRCIFFILFRNMEINEVVVWVILKVMELFIEKEWIGYLKFIIEFDLINVV